MVQRAILKVSDNQKIVMMLKKCFSGLCKRHAYGVQVGKLVAFHPIFTGNSALKFIFGDQGIKAETLIQVR